MSVAATVTAAMPVAAAEFNAIPVYESLKRPLSSCTSLLCFLLFAYVFYMRRSLADAMLTPQGLPPRWRVIPLVLIVVSVAGGLGYLAVLRLSVESAHEALNKQGVEITETADILRIIDFADTPDAFSLVALYLDFFVAAEAAFLIMASREYMMERTQTASKSQTL
jgi:hypothetical protein